MEITTHSAKVMPLLWALLALLGSLNSERSAAQGIDPVLVGHCLDSALNVTVTNGMAYVARGTQGFSIVDVRNPAAPVVLGEHAVSNAVSIAVQGNYAYVADLTNGLDIFSIANPAFPELVSRVTLAGPVLDLAIVNGYAYVAAVSNGLAVVDVRDPLHPATVSHYSYPSSSSLNFRQVKWNGHYLFVLDTFWGPLILELSNPAQPQLVGRFALSPIYSSFVIQGETMFVHQLWYTGYNPYVSVVDVRDPANLHVLGGGLPDSADRQSRFVAASRYIATWSDEELTLYDFQSNSLRRVGVFLLDSMQGALKQVTFCEGYAFLAGDSGLDIVEIEHPANPKILREFAPYGYAMVISGKFAYVAGGPDGFQVWDMEAAQGPVEIFNYQERSESFEDVALSGSHVLVRALDEDRILCFDVSDPLHPALLSDFDNDPDEEIIISRFSGDYAYICIAGRDGNPEPQRFYILDFSTPSNPHYIGSIQSRDSAEEPYCMIVSDGYAYVADSAGLQVLNVQDGAHPVTVRTYPILATCMAKANNLLCTWYAGEPYRLHFYEINTPGEVVSAGVLEGRWDVESMAITNNMLYLSDRRIGLVVLDVHNPAAVKIAGGNQLKTGGKIFFSNGKLFRLQQEASWGDDYGVTAYLLFNPEVRFDSVSRQGPVTLSIASPLGQNISLQRSSNLRDWEPWQTIVSSNRVMHVVDPDAVLSVPRFYRAVMP